MTTVLAVVPMRHNSERVPGKNYRELAGRPLYHHVLQTLSEVPEIDRIVVDTDSDFIMDDCSSAFPEVQLLLRPENLRDGAIPMNDVLRNTLSQADADVVVQTHSTNPFLKPNTLSSALTFFLSPGHVFDSVFSVTRLQARLWNESTLPMNHDPEVLLRTQDLAPVYIENSCFFIFTPQMLFSRGNRIGFNPYMVEMDRVEAHDIDDEADFAIAEALADRGIFTS